MPLAVMPRIERLDLARVELPADHPAAGPVGPFRCTGSSSSTRTGQFWSTLASKSPLAHHETPVQQRFSTV